MFEHVFLYDKEILYICCITQTANTQLSFFIFILMAIHDEGRFTMIQTKNTNFLKKKKCVQKWQKPESQDFYKSILLSTVKVKFNHSIKRK